MTSDNKCKLCLNFIYLDDDGKWHHNGYADHQAELNIVGTK